MIKLGSHVSMSAPDYILGSVKEALSYKANALMLYTGAPQNFKRVEIEKLKAQQGVELWKENGGNIEDIVVHAPYIINLANTVKPETYELGLEVLSAEIKRTDYIGAKYLVLHPGSYLSATLQQGIESIAKGLNTVLTNQQNCIVCLETMAGKGKEVGRTFEELKAIIDLVELKDKVGVCLDSCHIHDGGYDLSKLDEVLKQFDEIIGLDKLYVIHVNDSKNAIGAHKDRHANIGEGFIGFDNICNLVHHPLLEGKPMILETPWVDDKPVYKEEIENLREKKSPLR